MPSQPSDQELLAAISRGDQAALGQLYEPVRRDRARDGLPGRPGPRGRRRGRPGRVRGGLAPRRQLRAGACRRRAAGCSRSSTAARSTGSAAGRGRPGAVAAAADESGLWPEASSRRQRAEIVAALEALPGEQREAIELAFFGGLTHVEIAERTGQPSGMIKERMRLGLIKLRTVLQGREVEPRLE